MIIYNCSFIVPSAKGDDFISWMQSGRMLALAASPDSDSNPLDLRLTRLRAVVGDPDALREASTFPLEARFATLSLADGPIQLSPRSSENMRPAMAAARP